MHGRVPRALEKRSLEGSSCHLRRQDTERSPSCVACLLQEAQLAVIRAPPLSPRSWAGFQRSDQERGLLRRDELLEVFSKHSRVDRDDVLRGLVVCNSPGMAHGNEKIEGTLKVPRGRGNGGDDLRLLQVISGQDLFDPSLGSQRVSFVVSQQLVERWDEDANQHVERRAAAVHR